MVNSSTVVRIPSKLWISQANFPITRQSLAAAGSSCRAGEKDLHFKLAVAWANEIKKGDSSFYAPYIRALPTLADFRSFHPALATLPILRDFQPLPFMALILR